MDSFSITYITPDSADDGIKKILDGKDACGNEPAEIESRDTSAEIKYHLIAGCGIRSFVNNESNKLKSRYWAKSRKYMKIAAVVRLLSVLLLSLSSRP